MLVKLLPDNVARNWDTIKFAISESLPPVAGEGLTKMNNILEALLAGSLECWVSVFDEKIKAIGTTQVLHDAISDTHNLCIYSFYSYTNMGNSEWAEELNTLKRYAESRGCVRIIAYTKIPALVQLIQRLGGETDVTVLSINI